MHASIFATIVQHQQQEAAAVVHHGCSADAAANGGPGRQPGKRQQLDRAEGMA